MTLATAILALPRSRREIEAHAAALKKQGTVRHTRRGRPSVYEVTK